MKNPKLLTTRIHELIEKLFERIENPIEDPIEKGAIAMILIESITQATDKMMVLILASEPSEWEEAIKLHKHAIELLDFNAIFKKHNEKWETKSGNENSNQKSADDRRTH
jgi:hypothetical protein